MLVGKFGLKLACEQAHIWEHTRQNRSHMSGRSVMWREESDFLAASPLTRARARAPQNVRLLAGYAMFSHGILSYFVCVEKRKT